MLGLPPMADESPFEGTPTTPPSALDRLLGFRADPLRPLAEGIRISAVEIPTEDPSTPLCAPIPLVEAPESGSFWGRVWGVSSGTPVPARAARTELDVTLADRGIATHPIGRVLDVSLSGMMVRSEEPYAVGDGLAIRFRIPGREREIRCGAVVARVADAPVAGKFELGLRFTQLAAADRLEIEAFVASSTRVPLAGAA